MTSGIKSALDLQGSFATDWFGAPLPGAISYQVRLTESELLFTAAINVAPSYDPTQKAGDFVEGIWRYDAAELFIAEAEVSEAPLMSLANEDTTQTQRWKNVRYQEFNFSPLGAWWSCVFDSYRVRASKQPLPLEAAAKHLPGGNDSTISGSTDTAPLSPKIQTTLHSSSWSLEASIPRDLIFVDSFQQPSDAGGSGKLNVAFIINGGTFASLNARSHLEPDFHRLDTFSAM